MRPLVDGRKGHKKFLTATVDNSRICNKCNIEKPLLEFYPNKTCRLGIVGTCRSCSRDNVKRGYAANRKRRQEMANSNNRKKKRELVESFGGKCHDCGNSYNDCVYDFHHLDSSKKDVNPSHAMKWGKERMMKELEKCIMLCANCHRMRHYK